MTRRISISICQLLMVLSFGVSESGIFGLWFTYDVDHTREIYLSITNIEGVVVVVEASDNWEGTGLKIGKFDNCRLIVADAKGQQQEFWLQDDDTELVRSYNNESGFGGETLYYRVSNDKALEIYLRYF